MDDDIKFAPGTLKFTFGWCDLCEGIYVRCPECGNNTCNGGSGRVGNTPETLKDCDVCTLAHQYARLFYMTECTLCNYWLNSDGGRCGKHGGLPEIRPCKDFTGITPNIDKDGKLLPNEEELLKKIFGEETPGDPIP